MTVAIEVDQTGSQVTYDYAFSGSFVVAPLTSGKIIRMDFCYPVNPDAYDCVQFKTYFDVVAVTHWVAARTGAPKALVEADLASYESDLVMGGYSDDASTCADSRPKAEWSESSDEFVYTGTNIAPDTLCEEWSMDLTKQVASELKNFTI